MVRVYGKPQCVQCEYTKKKLEANEIPYVYHDITADDEARQLVEETGRTQLPMVIAETESKTQMWYGFSPDKIRALSAT